MKQYDELGRQVINSLDEIPNDMTENEVHEFWKKHSMSEKLLEESIIEDEDDDLPPPRRTK